MTTLTQNTWYRLSMSLLAASLVTACGDKSSPTGMSPLPATQQMNANGFIENNAQVQSGPDATSANSNNNNNNANSGLTGVISCRDFQEVNLRAVVRGTDVVVQYGIGGVSRSAFYSIRFWPDGRHVSTPVDHVIGYLEAGQGASGEFVAMSFEDLDRPVTLNYQVDVDVTRDEEHYRSGEVILGQCDRGGQLVVEPELEPICSMTPMFGTMTATGGPELHTVRVTVEAKRFEGSVELEWSNMGHTDIVARSELSTGCAGQSVELSWTTDGSWLRHAILVLRLLDQDGNVVASRTYTGGDFVHDQPDTWTLS